MSIKRPVHPLLIALPLVAFVVTIGALFATTRDPSWYRIALYANAAGVIVAALEAMASYVDAKNLAAGTVARDAGVRHAAFSALSLVLFAASGLVIYTRFATHQVPTIAAPAALAVAGLASLVVASAYGQSVLRIFKLGQAIVRYPQRLTRRQPAPPHPRNVPTIG